MQKTDATFGASALDSSSLSVLKTTTALCIGVTTTAWLFLPQSVLSDGSSLYFTQALEVLGDAVCSSSFQSVAVTLLGLCLYPGARNLTFWATKPSSGGQDVDSCQEIAATAPANSVQGLPSLQRHTRKPQAHQQHLEQQQETEVAQQVPRSRSLDLDDHSSSGSRRSSLSSVTMPSVQVELNPLPRLSFDFKRPKQASPQQQQQQQPPSMGRWRPSMCRITSGQDLTTLADADTSSAVASEPSPNASPSAPSRSRSRLSSSTKCTAIAVTATSATLTSPFASPPPAALPSSSSAATATDAAPATLPEQASIDLFYDACSQLTGASAAAANAASMAAAAAAVQDEEATACLEYTSSVLPPGHEHLSQYLADVQLLQLGSVLGERSCQAALRQRAMPPAVGSADSLYGCWDTDAFHGGWEAVVHEGCEGLRYWAWRRPLRKGLFMYMTKTVMEGASAREVRQFMLDDQLRRSWDDSTLEVYVLGPSGSAVREYQESGFMFSRCKFPAPMAGREYVYGRRVWHRSSDGGCYCISRALPSLPEAPQQQGRGVRVLDYASGYVIKSAPSRQGGPATEMVMVYFEDSQVRAGIINMAIRKGLWTLMQKTNTAFRGCQQKLQASLAEAEASAASAAAASSSKGDAAASSTPQAAAPAAEDKKAGSTSSKRGGWWAAAKGFLGQAANAAKGLVQEVCDTVAAAGRLAAQAHNAIWSFAGHMQWSMAAGLAALYRPLLSKLAGRRGHELNARNLRYLQALQQQQQLQLTPVYSWPAPQQLQQQQYRAGSNASSRPSSRSGMRAPAAAPADELLMWQRAGSGNRPMGSVDDMSCSASNAGSEASSAQRSRRNGGQGRQGRGRRILKKVVQVVGIKVAHTLLSISTGAHEQERRRTS